MNKFNELYSLDCSKYIEKKQGLSYLTWSVAWKEFVINYPNATYKIEKNDKGLPYFESDIGSMVYTSVTVDDITHEMWLPVMDGANKAMKKESYTYKVWDKYEKKMKEKVCEAYSMFDINKTIMRCLTKNLAMFGLGLSIYNGEDIPEDITDIPKAPSIPKDIKPPMTKEDAEAIVTKTPPDAIAFVKNHPAILELCKGIKRSHIIEIVEAGKFDYQTIKDALIMFNESQAKLNEVK